MENTAVDTAKGIEVVVEPEVKEKIDPKIAQDNITPDMPRYREVYWKMKSLEGKLEEAEEKKLSSEKLLVEFRTHNERLAKAIEDQVELSRNTIGMNEKKVSEDGYLNGLHERLKELKEKKINAFKTFEYETIPDMDDEIAEIKDEIKEFKTQRENISYAQEEEKIDPAFISFLNETSWMKGEEADPLMVQAAYTMDELLLKDEKWRKASVADRLKEVGRRIEARFNWKLDKGSGRKSVIGSEGVSKASSSSKVITLTPAQVAVANGLEIPLDRYARQLAIMGEV